MKLVLHNYWRVVGEPSRAHRASASSSSPYEYVVVNILQARAARRRLPREEPDGAGADARDHRGRRHGPRVHAVAADPRVPRRALPGAADPAEAIRTCARARARSPRSINSGIQPLQNLTDDERRSRSSAATTRCGRRASSPTASPRSRRLAAETAGAFCVGDDADDRRLLPHPAARVGAPVRRRPRAASSCLLAIEERCLALPAFQTRMPDRQPDAVK